MIQVNPNTARTAPPAPFRARLASRRGGSEIGRIGWATPESLQALVDDTRLVGRGGRLEIRVPVEELPQARVWLESLAQAMRKRGVKLRVLHPAHGEASSGATRHRRAA